MATSQMPAADSPPNAIEVFCSYAHEDEALRLELEKHLSILQSNGVINSWHDHAIPAGKEWASEIDEHLNSAQIILLLISPDFLASKYCREVEVTRALERHKAREAKVISVILRDVDWHGSPLSKLQALPRNAQPVTSWPNRDQAFKDITIGIRKVAEGLRRSAGEWPRPDEISRTRTEQTIGPFHKARKGRFENVTARVKPAFIVAAAVLSLLAGLAYFAAQRRERAKLSARDWTEVRYDDPALSNCMGVPLCLERQKLVARLKAVQDWKTLGPNDEPLLDDCMGYGPCLQASAQTITPIPGTLSIGESPYFGAIDLGSKGTKANLFSLHKNACPKQFVKETSNVCDVYGRIINTKLVSSMNDGLFTDAGMQDATDAVKQLLTEMTTAARENNLGKTIYFVVGSSGVARGKNKDALAASVKAATGVDMDFIDVKREGYFGLLAAVPGNRLYISLYVDIGSGNTKLGCLEGGIGFGSFQSAEIEYGSVSGRNKGSEKNPGDIRAGIQALMAQEVKPAYERESMDAPCLRNRERIYWTGGASWATATFMHPEEALSPTVVITKRDLDNFLGRLSDGSWNQHFQYSFPKDMPLTTQEMIRATAEKDRASVMGIFVREDLLSGVLIMKTVLGSANPLAVVKFVRNGGNFLYGYASEKYPETAPEKASGEEHK